MEKGSEEGERKGQAGVVICTRHLGKDVEDVRRKRNKEEGRNKSSVDRELNSERCINEEREVVVDQ